LNSTLRSVPAWAVHAFTASGAVLAFLSLNAIIAERWVEALAWLFLALAIDGVDGTLARLLRVRERLPRINGATLDLVIDYLTYVFVPTVFILRAGLMPESVALPLAAAIQLSSLYVFAREDMKTDDGYFRGFPALWNLVAFYLFVLQLLPGAGALLIGLFVLLTFAPIHMVHPFRVRDFGIGLPLLTLLWAVTTLAVLWPWQADPARTACVAMSLAATGLLVGLGLWRSIRGPRISVADAPITGPDVT